jgi:hypothetical protein
MHENNYSTYLRLVATTYYFSLGALVLCSFSIACGIVKKASARSFSGVVCGAIAMAIGTLISLFAFRVPLQFDYERRIMDIALASIFFGLIGILFSSWKRGQNDANP